MKSYLLIPVLLIVTASFGQVKKKPAPKEDKPPTQKEMDDMMKEMQKEMDQMSPEDKKAMDSLGFKMPDMKNIQKTVSGMSDAQIKKAYEDEKRIVPEKDAARINIALATTLNDANKKAFLTKTHDEVLSQLSSPTKSSAIAILSEIKKANASMASTAFGLWMEGRPTLALYIMGEACVADPANDNNLNNYAAFLTTCGGEQMALPILNFLNKRYPQNSTVLNNIAQAWLGLGDLQRAEKYTDSTIRIYASHPQANMAKSLLEQNKGNIPGAIAAAKVSIHEAYSLEKEHRLKKLGYEIKSEDIDWNIPLKSDPCGLGKFVWPEYPLDVEQNKLAEEEWNRFKDACQEKIDKLNIELAKAEQNFAVKSEQRTKQIISASQKREYIQPMPTHAAKAIAKFGPSVEDIRGNSNFVFAKELEAVIRARKRAEELQTLCAEKQEKLNKKYEDKIGEGKENPLEQICKDENEIRTAFLRDANGQLQTANRQYLNYVKRRTSDLLNYYQFVQWPEQFEMTKLTAQISWLTQIKDQNPFFKEKSSWCPKNTPKSKPSKSDSLQNFDDVACQYVSEMNMGCYKIKSTCSETVGEFDCAKIKINIKDNVETGKYSGSVIIGKSQKLGPLGLKAKGTVGALWEGDNSGITNVGGTASIGINAGPVSIAGVEGIATYNTGISTSGKFLGRKIF